MSENQVCDICEIQKLMKRIMDDVEKIPEWHSPLYDEALLAVFDSADDAYGIFRHEHVGEDGIPYEARP